MFNYSPDSFQVELCKSFGDPTKPKAWSKHSQKAPAPEKQPEKPLASAASAGTKKVSLARSLEALLCVRDGEGWPGVGRRGQSSWHTDAGVLVLLFGALGSLLTVLLGYLSLPVLLMNLSGLFPQG